MKSWLALVQREYLEHRGAFLYAPMVIVGALVVALALAFVTNQMRIDTTDIMPMPVMIYEAIYLGAVRVWGAYLMIALFFYFADAFSADRKGNSLLFWKSMPQSDLKILASKLLAGATLFPLMIFGWLLVTSAIGYIATILIAARIPEIAAPGTFDVFGAWVQITLAAFVYFALNLVWYAPVFAWVGMLSTAFRGWSIPLAFAIPVIAIAIESVLTYSGGVPQSAIWDFLAWRLETFYPDDRVIEMFRTGEPILAGPMIAEMLAGIDIPGLVGGLVFAAVATWAASEYRRRRIEA